MVPVLQPVGYPIRTFADHFLLADPRNFSQLYTSFFASQSLGIHRAPLFRLFRVLRPFGFIYTYIYTPQRNSFLISSMSMIVGIAPIGALPRSRMPGQGKAEYEKR